MVKIEAKRLAVAVLAFSSKFVGGTASTTSCCGSAPECCPQPSVGDDAQNWKVVYDQPTCCPGPSSGAVGCSAYGAGGCRFCKDDCGGLPADQCVECSSIPSRLITIDGPSPAQSGNPYHGPPTPGNTQEPVFDPDADDDISGVFNDGGDPDMDWAEDIDRILQPGSYNFNDDEYDCASCAWDNMPKLKQRLLTERSRSMVCDTTCLKKKGDDDFGVNMCNYFNAGRECRACCHKDHLVEGCMPCEGSGSCEVCIDMIKEICEAEPCGEECQAFVCCSVGWGEYSGCTDTMPLAMAELASYISEQCSLMFTCETAELQCSDNARTCSARGSFSRHLQEVAQDTCPTVTVNGAGVFDTAYTMSGALDTQQILRATGTKKGAFVLQSLMFDACAKHDSLSSISAGNTDIIIARSTTGSLTWDDGMGSAPHAEHAGIGCNRHVWLLQDSTGAQSTTYITVDPSEHPRYIASDWVKVHPAGEMTRSELTLSCADGTLSS